MSEVSRLRLLVLRVLVLSLLVTLLGRLWYLQVVDAGRYAEAATDNRVREVVTSAARGQIVDALGRPLARNRTSVVVSVDRASLAEQPDDGAAVLDRLATLLAVPVTDLADRLRLCGPGVDRPCWNGSPYQPVPVLRDAPPAVAVHLAEHREDYPGVLTGVEPVRDYPHGSLAAHSLGYLSPVSPAELTASPERNLTDLVGRAGLEQVYDDALRGVDGTRRLLVDSVGTVTGELGVTPAEPGHHLVLSLDAGVQQLAETALQNAMKRARQQVVQRGPFAGQHYPAPAGAAVVLEARTGRVVALASAPSYDPTLFVGGISGPEYQALQDEAAGVPLLSRATQGQYAPGSTFKPIATVAAVDAGYPLDGRYPCPSLLRVGNREFRNFESAALGEIDLRTALVLSCDTVFYQFGYDMWLADGGLRPSGQPREPMVTMAEAFGLGGATGIDLPAESAGRIADRAFKRQYWEQHRDEQCRRAEQGYPDVAAKDPAHAAYLTRIARENCADGHTYRAGDAVNLSIGQGDTLVTPMQLAVAYAAIANGGTVFAPRLGKAVIAADGRVVREIEPEVRGRLPLAPAVLGYVQDALAGVPREGTAAGAYAGFPLDTLPVAGKTGTAEVAGKTDTSWFASYAPADDPRYVVVGMVAEAGQGGRVAAPLTREIYEGLFGIGRPAVQPCGGKPVPLPQVGPDGGLHSACPGGAR